MTTKLHKIVALATHDGTPIEEARAAIMRAAAIMQKTAKQTETARATIRAMRAREDKARLASQTLVAQLRATIAELERQIAGNIPLDKDAEIARLLSDGASYADIAAKVRCSFTRIARVAKATGTAKRDHERGKIVFEDSNYQIMAKSGGFSLWELTSDAQCRLVWERVAEDEEDFYDDYIRAELTKFRAIPPWMVWTDGNQDGGYGIVVDVVTAEDRDVGPDDPPDDQGDWVEYRAVQWWHVNNSYTWNGQTVNRPSIDFETLQDGGPEEMWTELDRLQGEL